MSLLNIFVLASIKSIFLNFTKNISMISMTQTLWKLVFVEANLYLILLIDLFLLLNIILLVILNLLYGI